MHWTIKSRIKSSYKENIMAEKKISKREQVKALIGKGGYTKQMIADELSTSIGSIGSQMTYLRWMGNFIKYDADKVLSFVTEEEHDAWQEELKANRKTTTTAAKTPEEQAIACQKAIGRQETQLTNWNKKLETIEIALDEDEDSEELQELLDEANANITLLTIKIRRNEARAETLPEAPEEPDVPEELAEVNTPSDTEDEEELL